MDYILIALIVALHIEIAAFFVVYSKKHKPLRGGVRPTFIDTSVLMDGRIMAAVNAGFVPAEIIIPKSVLAEMQLLADSADSEKRSKARHGLDVAALLQDSDKVATRVLNDGTAEKGVDEQLLALAKRYNGAICTIDFNLAKVAMVEQIPILNINELAQQLRMNYLPGEKVSIKVTQKGNDQHQGVGYLADGTMVVIEQASADVNKTIEVEFIRSLQTVAGRMMFAKKVKKQEAAKTKSKKTAGSTAPKGRAKRSSPEDELLRLANDQ